MGRDYFNLLDFSTAAITPRINVTPENGRLSGVSETRSAKSHPRKLTDFSVVFLASSISRKTDCI
jgi:hypothetical protein